MNTNSRFIILFIMFFTLAAGGCTSVDKANAPVPTSAAFTPTAVQVTLSSSSIANGGNTTVSATVTDASSRVVPDISVSFTVISSTAGSFSPATVTTDANGFVSTTFTAGAAGNDSSVTIRASITVNSTTVSGSSSLTIGTPPVVATALAVSLSPATLTSAGGAVTVSATVTGSNSAPVVGTTVSFTVSDTAAGSFSAASATTDAAGVASVTFTANAGDMMVEISATDGSLTNSATLTIGNPPPPVAATMNLSTTDTQVAILQSTTISVSLLSSAGDPVFSTDVDITISSGDTLGSLSSTSTITTLTVTTNSSGNASATFFAGNSSGLVTITATSGSLSKDVSLLITSDPSSVALTITDSALLNGENTNITARVLNAANQPVSVGTTVTFTLTYGGTSAPGSLSATTAFTLASGDATVTFTADPLSTGPVFITATAGTVTSSTQIIQVDPALAGSILFVSAVPSVIGIAGSGTPSDSIVTFQVMNSVGSPLQNQSVTFSIVTGPIGATLGNGGGLTSTGSTDIDGNVSTLLHAGAYAGPVRIMAATTITSSPLVELSTSAGAISIGGGVPSYNWFSIASGAVNLPALDCENVTTTVNVNMADRFGNYNILEGTTVSFATAYGAISTYNFTNASGQCESEFRTQAPYPSDGRVRVLVYATGEERFSDLDADGLYTAGTDTMSAADDLPEPYVDANHNGAHDSGELYFHWSSTVPGSSTGYDPANGEWDATIPIWKTYDIWLTGSPAMGSTKTRVECCDPSVTASCSLITSSFTIAAESRAICYVYLMDRNGNALAGGTTVDLAASFVGDSWSTIETYSGSVTVGDGSASVIPVVGFSINNDMVSSETATQTITVAATINWPGACGSGEYVVSYPSNIIMTPPLSTTLSAPSGVAAGTGANTGEVDIVWDNVNGATSYNLYWGTAAGVLKYTITNVTSPYTHTGLTSGTTYFYAVKAVNAADESTKSGEVSAAAL